MPSPKELAKALAYRGEIRNTPQNSFLGGVANFLAPVSEFADQYKISDRIPFLGGMSAADLTGLKGAQSLVNDMSYGKSPISGASLQTTKVDPRVLDLAGVTGAMMPVAKGLGKAALREGARQIETGTGIGRAALDPRMRMFAGEGAKTADKQALKVAKDMKAAGVPDEQIHAKTGWTLGFPDGQPRFEIDDNPATIRGVGTVETVAGKRGTNMGDVMWHPSLYDEYPNTRQIPLEFKGKSGGAYGTDMFGNEGIMLGKNVSGKSTPLHELQHSIQRQEGFAGGGSPDMFMRGYQNKLKDLNSQVTDINQQMRAVSGTPQYDELMNTRSGIVKQIQAIEGREGLGALEAANKDYRRLAGEAEARLTQSRMNMTPAERAASYPPSMFDVPVKDQIVRYGGDVGGAMMQRPKTEFEILHDTRMGIVPEGKAMSVQGLEGHPKLNVMPNKRFALVEGNSNLRVEHKPDGTFTISHSPAWGETGKPFTLNGDSVDNLISTAESRLQRSENAMTAAAKGKHSKTVGGMLEMKHGDNFEYAKSARSNSQYITHTPTGAKIRISDHKLPDVYESADFEVSNALGKKEQAQSISKFLDDYATDRAKDDASIGVGGAMIPRPKTEFEILHDTAQRNAALPKEQGGLGLPTNNTYMDRANAPGMFPTDAYTGTNQDIRSLDPSKAKFAREGSGSWASENPEFANSYAGRPDGNVMPLRINTSKFGELDAANSNWNKIPSDEPIRHANGTDSTMSEYIQSVFDDFGNTNLASNIARKMGDKGLIVNNVKDYGGYVSGAGDVPEFATNFAIHDPSQVRSRFAAFDPMRRHEADILAGVGVGGMLDPQAIAEALRQQDRK